MALTRFKRSLPRVRLRVRGLTHTLHLPPAHPELYGGPHAKWLRDILLYLPHLQSLVVSSLPFFDHGALSALRYDFPKSEAPKAPSIFPLRLLIAANCTNTTSRGLDTALSHWPSLVFLDLSDTPAARDASVLWRLESLHSLQVVKLRHVDLRDQDLEILADAITTRVRSLDVRDNRLTDASIRKLLCTCFNSHEDGRNGSRASHSYRRSFEGVAEEDWPLGVRRPMDTLLDEFTGEDLDQRFIKRLTNGCITRLPSEDLPPPGLTHLYLANNLFTIEGIAGLLKTKNLHVLDVGKIDTLKTLNRPGARLSLTRPQEIYAALPGAEKLTPILGEYGAGKLSYLRIHHELVTKPAPPIPAIPELPGIAWKAVHELDTTEAPIYELGDTAPTYEVGDENSTPKYELPGDPIHMIVSPAMNKPPRETTEEETYSQVRRGSAFAPEVVSAVQADYAERTSRDREEPRPSKAPQIENGSGAVLTSQRYESPNSRTSTSAISSQVGKNTSSDAAVGQIQDKLHQTSLEDGRGLLPSALPKLRTLVLTNVPCTSNEPRVVKALKAFVSDCADEYRLANLRAQFERNNVRRSSVASLGRHKNRPEQIFALREIVLEMATSQDAPTTLPISPQTPTAPRFPAIRDWSSTEDSDTEALWTAAENDFSFFGDEECGLPDKEPGMHFPRSTLAEKLPLPTNSTLADPEPPARASSKPTVIVDTIQELAAFRRERKAAFDLARRRGAEFVDGYWPGEVKIIRQSRGQTGFVNDYGSVFEMR